MKNTAVPLATILLIAGTAAAVGGHDHEHAAAKPPSGAALKAMRAEYPKTIEPIFVRKCFDCHSAKTNYPWYYKAPGAKGTIDRDISRARRMLDMTGGFPFRGVGDLAERLGHLREVVTEGDMPPFLYRLAHPGSRLTRDDKHAIIGWLDGKVSLTATATGTPTGR